MAAHMRTADPASRRCIGPGDVVGSREPDGTHAWRGIPYAAPPVGPLRWRAPQAVSPWAGLKQALQHGPMAPQFGGLLAPVPPALHGQVVGEEDCLSLNVFAPAWSPDEVPRGTQARPVMVWIHGGGNAVGTSATYDVARKLAVHHGAVVVTVNYRLGVLGWFTHPALQQQPGLSDAERSGNFALLDLIAALRWVREHIGAFGGDAGCVTDLRRIGGRPERAAADGQPAGRGPVPPRGGAVAGVRRASASTRPCTAPSRRSRAAAAARWKWRGACMRPRAQSATDAAAEAAWLRALSPQQLLAAHRPGSVGIYLTPRPTRDGTVLPLEPPCPSSSPAAASTACR